MNALYYVLLIAGGYLLGSLSPSIVLSRKAWGIDIRDHGSHNAGTTNMLRVMGWRYGVLTFVFDLIKGVLPALIADLDDAYGELAELNEQILRSCGAGIVPFLKEGFDPAGKKAMLRRIRLIVDLAGNR